MLYIQGDAPIDDIALGQLGTEGPYLEYYIHYIYTTHALYYIYAIYYTMCIGTST